MGSVAGIASAGGQATGDGEAVVDGSAEGIAVAVRRLVDERGCRRAIGPGEIALGEFDVGQIVLRRIGQAGGGAARRAVIAASDPAGTSRRASIGVVKDASSVRTAASSLRRRL